MIYLLDATKLVFIPCQLCYRIGGFFMMILVVIQTISVKS